MDATAEQVIEFAERNGLPMTPWQRELTTAMFTPGWSYLTAARPNGRTVRKRILTEFAAFKGEHVHAIGRDGQWCVTRQPVGYLYTRIR